MLCVRVYERECMCKMIGVRTSTLHKTCTPNCSSHKVHVSQRYIHDNTDIDHMYMYVYCSCTCTAHIQLIEQSNTVHTVSCSLFRGPKSCTTWQSTRTGSCTMRKPLPATPVIWLTRLAGLRLGIWSFGITMTCDCVHIMYQQ